MLHRFNFAIFSKGPPATKRENHEGEGNEGSLRPLALRPLLCGQLARVALSFLEPPQRKHSSRTPEEKEKVRFLRSGSLTPAVSQRPKKRELSPAATVPPPPQRLVAPVPWNLTPAYFQGNQ
jgi:hypothetical protein